jgi:L-alanine-DL-glutamate epimerase-like enolase superfamily enzyme
MNRRTLLGAPSLLIAKGVEVRVESVRMSLTGYRYRAPYKFGGKEVDRVTMLNVDATVRTRDGRRAEGWAAMSMGNVWAYPGKPYDTTLPEMVALGREIEKITNGCSEYGHPIDLNTTLEPAYLKAAPSMPKLAVLVTASPFDAAIHDAYGKLLGRSAFATLSSEFMPRDLSHYLGAQFKGEYPDRYVNPRPRPRVAIYHSVGAGDAIEDADLTARLNDGLPETLAAWIRRDRLTHIKIKLQGNNLEWDIDRVARIESCAARVQAELGRKGWRYCLDFNENCPNVGYFLDFLRGVKEKSPAAFARAEYVEQPTRRDLKADRANVMHEAAKLRPVVIDESLTDLETLLLAREMGYTGLALKACKGQTQAVLMAAAGRKFGMFLTVQDLTCPGAAFVHSAGLGAHVPGVAGIEANAREYVPAANEGWAPLYPGLFELQEGAIRTSGLTGPGIVPRRPAPLPA